MSIKDYHKIGDKCSSDSADNNSKAVRVGLSFALLTFLLLWKIHQGRVGKGCIGHACHGRVGIGFGPIYLDWISEGAPACLEPSD